MIGALPRPKRNPNAGRKPRAIFYRRWARLIKRKRVAFMRLDICSDMERLQKKIARMERVARLRGVPMEPMAPLPVVPSLPGKEWVEHLLHMGELRPPVVAAKTAPNDGFSSPNLA